MDEDFYEYDDDFEQVESTSRPRQQNNKGFVQRTGEFTKNTGKTIKNTGKTMKKAGETVNKITNAGEKGASTVEKVAGAAKKGAKAVKQGAKVVKQGGKALDAAGKGTKAAGKGIDAAGKGTEAVGNALGAIPYVGPALKAAFTALGKGEQAAGKGTQGVGLGMQGAGKGVQAGATGVQAGATGAQAAASAAENAAKGSKIANKVGNRFGDGLKNAGQGVSNVGKKIEDTGNKVEATGKDLDNIKKPFTGTLKTILRSPIYLAILIVVSFIIGISFYYNGSVAPTAENMERLKNYISGNGSLNETSSKIYKTKDGEDNDEEKLFEEAKKWYEKSNGQIDLPLVFSALYYPDNNSDKNFDFSIDIGDEEDGNIFEDILNYLIPDYFKGGVRRVRKLCKNQLDGSKVVSEDEYRKYLKKYINKQPEFKDLIENKTEEEKDKKIDYIIEQIYEQRNWYVGVFGDFKSANSEEYSDVCKGAIDETLVSQLKLPVDIKNSNITFNGSDSYGITGGVSHNGVDLTSSNSGIKEGDSVYSVAPGSIVSIEKSLSKDNNTNTKTQNSSSIDNFLFIGDSRYSGETSNKLKELGSNIQVDAVVASTPMQWVGTIENGSGTVRSSMDSGTFTLPSSVNGVSIMLGVNDVSQTGTLSSLANSLHERYPNAIIYINSVFHVGTNYTGISDLNSKIDSFNDTMKKFCDNNNWAQYIDITTGLYDNNKYLKSEFSSDGLHLTSSTGIQILVNNIKNNLGSSVAKNEDGGITVKIKHSLLVNNTKYEFYSVLGNIQDGSVTLKEGDAVDKGDVVGKVGKTNSGIVQLHYEFKNQNDTSIDPTNLFVVCTSDDGVLYGNTTEEKFWNYFVSSGYNKFQTAAIMGNVKWESGFRSDNVEDCASAINESSFVSGVDNGSISKDKFLLWPGNGCERVYSGHSGYRSGIFGFGISQWTSVDRKSTLYDKAKSKNASISDLGTQLGYLKEELDAAWLYPNYQSIWKGASSENDIGSATEAYCHGFEIAAGCTNRATDASNFYNQFKDKEIVYGNSGGNSAIGNSLVEEAKKSIGVPYVSGGTNLTSGVDCSGFMQSVYAKMGISIPRTEQHQAQASNFTVIYNQDSDGEFNDSMLRKLQKGDLLFFANSTSVYTVHSCYNEIGHVAMYVGEGQYIHAPQVGDSVHIAPLSSRYGKLKQVSRWNGNKTYDTSVEGTTRCYMHATR